MPIFWKFFCSFWVCGVAYFCFVLFLCLLHDHPSHCCPVPHVSDRVLPTLLSQTGCYLHCCLRQGATYKVTNQILQSCSCADLKVFHEAQFTTSATILLLTNTHLQVFHQMLQDHPTTLLQDFILTCMCSMIC